jgi:hypothetical protein
LAASKTCKVGAGLTQSCDFVGLQSRVHIHIQVRVFHASNFGLWVAVGPSLKVFLRQAMLQSDIKSEVGAFIVGLEREASLFAMDIAFDVQVFDLGNAKQQVCRGGEVVIGACNKGRDSAEGIKSINDVD